MEPRLSDDGWWWFDGSVWLPAVSQDGRYRFNGGGWERTGAPVRLAALALMLAGVALFVGLVASAFICYLYGISAPEYPGQPLPRWVVQPWDFTLGWGGLVWLTVSLILVTNSVGLYLSPPRRLRIRP